MTEQISQPSPRRQARIAGVLYLMTGGAAWAFMTRSTMIVRGDAAATAHNILAHEPLFRLAFGADLIAFAAYTGVAAMLYGLLKPVSRSLSLVAAFIGLAGCAISAVAALLQLAPLVLLGGQDYLAALTMPQLQALSLASLKLHGIGLNLGILFFGFYCLLIGCLIVGSTFIPRIIGVLMAIGGLSYLTYTFAGFLAPAFATQLYPYILVPPGLGEGSLLLWLIVFGVNAEKWRAQARAA